MTQRDVAHMFLGAMAADIGERGNELVNEYTT